MAIRKFQVHNRVKIIDGFGEGFTGVVVSEWETSFGVQFVEVAVAIDRKPIMVPFFEGENAFEPTFVQNGCETIYEYFNKRASDVEPI